MDINIDKVNIQSVEASTSKGRGGKLELVSLEIDVLQTPILVHEISLNFRCAGPLAQNINLVRADATRPAGITVGTGVPGFWSEEAAEIPVPRARALTSPPALTSRRRPVCEDLDTEQVPLVLVSPRVATEIATSVSLSGIDGSPAPSWHICGFCHGRIRAMFQCTAPGGPRELLQAILAALPTEEAAEFSEKANEGSLSLLTFLFSRTLHSVRLEAIPLTRTSITAAHLIPLINAAERLRAAGPAHATEAAEADLLAGFALMRSRKFVQCREMWKRCTRNLLAGSGMMLITESEASLRSASAASTSVCDSQQRRPALLEAQTSLGCSLSISPFAHRISASCEPGVQRAIFLQVLIAACALEHGGAPLQEVLAALHLATRLHLIDLQATPSLQIRLLDTPHDAPTVLFTLQPHLIHVLCAVINETLKTETVTQSCQITASALRCLDFVVHTCISCAFDSLVIDTIVRCFNSCDAEPRGATHSMSSFASPVEVGPKATAAAHKHNEEKQRRREDGKEDLRDALHHLVETCHDVLPSVSGNVLQQAAQRLVEQLLGSQSQPNWPSLHSHLLRLLMRIVVLLAGDVVPFLLAKPSMNAWPCTSSGSIPFLDYLLRLLSAAPAEERSGSSASSLCDSCTEVPGFGMPYVGQRCWQVLRVHFIPVLPRQDIPLFVDWLACSLSDSRSSYPDAQSLLLAIITDLAKAGTLQPHPLSWSTTKEGGCSAEGDLCEVPEDTGAPVLRAQNATATTCGIDLHRLVRPLHDWLLLIASKQSTLRGLNEGSQGCPTQKNTGLAGKDAASVLCGPETQGVHAGPALVCRRLLSEGLLPVAVVEEDEEEEEQVLVEAGRAAGVPRRAALGHAHDGGMFMQSSNSNRSGHPDGHRPHRIAWDEDVLGDKRNKSGGEHIKGTASNVVAPAHLRRRQSGEVLQQETNPNAQHLLVFWQTLVAVIGALPTVCRPNLHLLARPVLEGVQAVCQQGSPPKQALCVAASVLQDLAPCDEESAPFMKSLLLEFCEWIPHSVFDETFSVLEQMLRLIGPGGLDEQVMRALIHSMLNQYTSRSKAQRQSQQAFVDLVMAKRPVGPLLKSKPQQTVEEPVTSRMCCTKPDVSRISSQGDTNTIQPKDHRNRSRQTNEVLQDVDDPAEDAQEDISHFEGVVHLCFLGVAPATTQSSANDVDDAATVSQTDKGLDGCPTDGDMTPIGTPSRSPAAGSDAFLSAIALNTPPSSSCSSGVRGSSATLATNSPGGNLGTALADSPVGIAAVPTAELDLVERLQFLSAVFRAMRFSHLVFIVDRGKFFIEALRVCLMHALEKVRLLALELLHSICVAAFDRYLRRWASKQPENDQHLQAENKWWALLEGIIDLAVLPFAPTTAASSAAGVAAGSRPGSSFVGLSTWKCERSQRGQELLIGTPAVLLACCHLLHVARPRGAGSDPPIAGFPVDGLTHKLAAPLMQLAQLPWLLPRLAALSAVLVWVPLLHWGKASGACDLLENTLCGSLRHGDCLDRSTALMLVPTLVHHRGNDIPLPLCKAILDLRHDWNVDVRNAVSKVSTILPPDAIARVLKEEREAYFSETCNAAASGHAGAVSGPLVGRCSAECLASCVAEEALPDQDVQRRQPAETGRCQPLFPDVSTSEAGLLGGAAAWGISLWDSVYVDDIPAVSNGRLYANRCALDRFEDFLDAGSGNSGTSHGLRRSSRAKGTAAKFKSKGTVEDEAPQRVDPDPELSMLLAEGRFAGKPVNPNQFGEGVQSRAQVPLVNLDDEDVVYDEPDFRRTEELEEEEDLGIIDDGDEEWLEVLDVIREHSAVTIFNHTDSTWYVSSKHPNSVRPLHGKRRHPSKPFRQRSPSPPDVGIVHDKQTLSSSVRGSTCAGARTSGAPRMLCLGGTTSKGSTTSEVSYAVGGDRGGATPSFQLRLQRRPHSAPSPAYGRSPMNDRRTGPLAQRQHDSMQSPLVGVATGAVPQRTGRSPQVSPSVEPSPWGLDRAVGRDKSTHVRASTVLREDQSLQWYSLDDAPHTQPHASPASSAWQPQIAEIRRELLVQGTDLEVGHVALQPMPVSPNMSEDDTILEDDGGSSSSGTSGRCVATESHGNEEVGVDCAYTSDEPHAEPESTPVSRAASQVPASVAVALEAERVNTADQVERMQALNASTGSSSFTFDPAQRSPPEL